jgi:hypothetical protein
MGFVNALEQLAGNETTGFSPSGPIYFWFSGPINAPQDDPVGSVAPGATVFLVDVDPASPNRLERNPVHIRLTTQVDSVRPAYLLQILPVPGRDLRPNTKYAAIVLRSLGAPGTAFLGQCSTLTTLLQGGVPAGAQGIAVADVFQPIIPALLDLKINPVDVAAATVFTTGDPIATLEKQVPYVAGLPPITPGSLGLRDDWPSFTALKGTIDLPQYQAGTPPFLLGGGNEVKNPAGLPLAQGTDTANFQLSVPKGKMPATGFPLYFFVHGTGGDCTQAIDRGRQLSANTPSPPGTGIASWVGPQGWGTACVSLALTPDRIGFLSFDGYVAYNFLNPVAFRDNFVQMLLELVHFRSMVLSLQIDPALCPQTDASASPNGKIFFDPNMVVFGGQSLGSYLAGMLASMLPCKGAILSGAGGSWIEFPFGPTNPVPLANVVSLLALPIGDNVDQFHPLIAAADAALGAVDNTHFHRHILREPAPGVDPPNLLVVEGHVDHQVPENLQRALILAIGLDLAGPEVGATPQDMDAIVLPISGRSQLPYPVQGNWQLASGAKKTAVYVRYPEDGILEGHYVFFQQPAVIPQVQGFLADLVAGNVPTIR